MRPAARGLATLAAAVIATCVWAGPALAAFGISAFDTEVTADANHTIFTQAAGHPFAITASFQLNQTTDSQGRPIPDGALRDVRVDLPPGFVGNAASVPACPGIKELLTFACPNSSQVGVTSLDLNSSAPFTQTAPIYNLQPPAGVPARFGFQINGTTQVVMDASIRTASDYGLSVTIRNASQGIPMLGASVTFWGVPAAPVHDVQRCGFFVAGDQCIGPPNTFIGPNPAGVVPSAFLTNPGSCLPASEGTRTGLEAMSWQQPAQTASAFFDGPGLTGCEKLAFDPRLRVSADSSQPDTPTGMELEISVPQDGLTSLAGLAPAHARSAGVTLPEGMTLSPPSADGLQACSDAAFAVAAGRAPDCPNESKIGDVTVDTSVLDEQLAGSVYVGQQRSSDPESGELFRVLLYAASEARGVFVKLPGQVKADAATGRVEAVFANNPQLPFSRLALHFKGGARAPFATPASCGEGAITGAFGSWAGQQRAVTAGLPFACGGAPAFAPTFAAGTREPVAGAFSPLDLRIGRADGQPYLSGLSLRMPTGLAGKVSGVELCGDRQATDGTCPGASRVGSVIASAGPGAYPLSLPGTVFLTGAYKDAPYGLSVVVPVRAGPFDLGTVVVRQGIYVDPVDARVSVVSDPLPTIVKGVPGRLRQFAVDLDRPGFIVNPTSCDPKAVKAALTAVNGESAARATRFQVGDCAALPFKPRSRLRLTGLRQTRIGRHPGITATVAQRAGQANLKKVRVALPLALALEPENARQLCEYQDGLDGTCPRASIVGRATARSPLLKRPLSGPVYFVKGIRRDRRTGRAIRTLPTFLVALRGEVAIDLRATSAVSGNRLVTTFSPVPDAPISHFELNLDGGRNGILVITRRLCGRRQVADLRLDAQNGKRYDPRVTLGTPCASNAPPRRSG